MRQHVGIAKKSFYLFACAVKFGIVNGVFNAPFVYVVCRHPFCSRLCCHYRQDTRSATTVEKVFPTHFHSEDFAYNHSCCLMVSCAESLPRVNHNVNHANRNVRCVRGVVYYTFAIHVNRLKSYVLPFLIPVLVFHLAV